MLRIAIVEDEAVYSSQIKSYIEEYGRKKHRIFFVRIFDSAVSLLDSDFDFDIYFLDIQMPQLSGMDAAKKLRSTHGEAVIAFITSLRSYAIEGYEVGASDYILKPVEPDVFNLKFARILKRIGTKGETSLTFTSGRSTVRLNADDIIYLESSDHFTVYHTEDADFSRRISLSDAEKELPSYFARCKSSFIVNLGRVDSISGDSVIAGGNSVSIGRVYKKDFINRLERYMECGR